MQGRLTELCCPLTAGGRIITVGSDAHTASRMGDHLEEAYRILRMRSDLHRSVPSTKWNRSSIPCKQSEGAFPGRVSGKYPL